ncbi:MAG: glycosyltransferase, partial [Eubacteriales bacterium]
RYNLPHVASFHSKYKDDINMRLKVNLKMPGEIISRYVVSFYNRCDYIWSVSQGTANTLREYGYTGEVLVMPNGCDMPISHRTEEGRNKVVKDYNLNGDYPILLFVGRHTFVKNTDIIINALGALARHGQKFNMLFVGDGEDAAKMVDMVKIQGLEKMVHFAGKISERETLKRIYTSADLFVFPSVYDNAPLVVREAAACGCASALIAGSNSAEGLEDGVNAFLSAESVEDVALTLYAALNNSDLGAIGKNARRDIYLSWYEVLGMVHSEYEKILTDWEKRKPKRPMASENFNELMSYFDISKDRKYEIGWKRAERGKEKAAKKVKENEEG